MRDEIGGITMKVICPYCGNEANLVLGIEIYPGRESAARKLFYECLPCDAHVGCHRDSTTPFGTLANYELRGLRQKTHREFDWLYKNPEKSRMRRKDSYKWLARQLDIAPEDCHIGMFDRNQCKRAIAIVQAYKKHYHFDGRK